MMTDKIINKPYLPEFCRGEIHDFVLELVRRELKSIPVGEECRRRELCEAILSVNREVGERERLRAGACEIIKNWNSQEAQITLLEKLGFTITKGRKHFKLRRADSSYFKMLSATPSDFRSGANGVSELTKKFF